MFNDYLESAIKTAKYEILEDNSVYAEIPECPGVYANAESFEQCRSNLIDALEGWVIVRLRLNLNIPVISNIDLNKIEQENSIYFSI